MQGEVATQLGRTIGFGPPKRTPSTPPCGDRTNCVCWPDDRVTIADLERMADELGMPLSALLA